MNFRTLSTMLLISALFGAIACGSSDEVEQAAKEMEEALNKNDPQDVGDAMKKMQQAFSGAEDVEPVNFRKLKKLLPDELFGIAAKKSGEKSGGFGMKFSKAEADYRSDEGENIEITITDMGTMKGFAGMASAAWLMADIDRETDTGFERTSTYDGHKSFEKFDTASERGEVSVVVGKRFIVNVKGYRTTFEHLKDAISEVDLGQLDDMKDEGVK